MVKADKDMPAHVLLSVENFLVFLDPANHGKMITISFYNIDITDSNAGPWYVLWIFAHIACLSIRRLDARPLDDDDRQ